MKTDKHYINTIRDAIHMRGAMDMLVSDIVQHEIIDRFKDILRAYTSGNGSSEPHQQHQNHAEREYQHVKSTTNNMMEHSGSPASTCLLDLFYFSSFSTILLLILLIGHQSPLQVLFLSTCLL